jgi:nuclear pore complex protein Nup93
MDAKEALQYVYCVCLSADQGGGVGKEQVENAWEQVRRIIVLANTGAAWEELVGGFRPDGTRFVRDAKKTHYAISNIPAERSH